MDAGIRLLLENQYKEDTKSKGTQLGSSEWIFMRGKD